MKNGRRLRGLAREYLPKKINAINSKMKTSCSYQLPDNVKDYSNNRSIQEKKYSKLGVKLELVLYMCPRVGDGGRPVETRSKGHGRRQTLTTSAYI